MEEKGGFDFGVEFGESIWDDYEITCDFGWEQVGHHQVLHKQCQIAN